LALLASSLFSIIILSFGCLSKQREQTFLVQLTLAVEDPSKEEKELYEIGTIALKEKIVDSCKEQGFSNSKLDSTSQRCWWRDDSIENGQRIIVYSCEGVGKCSN